MYLNGEGLAQELQKLGFGGWNTARLAECCDANAYSDYPAHVTATLWGLDVVICLLDLEEDVRGHVRETVSRLQVDVDIFAIDEVAVGEPTRLRCDREGLRGLHEDRRRDGLRALRDVVEAVADACIADVDIEALCRAHGRRWCVGV